MLHHEPGFYGATGPFPRAYLAVDFFFLLSGFVLARAYEPRLGAGMTARQLMEERVRRLWPMIAVGLCIGATLHLIRGGGVITLPALGVMLLFVPILNGGGAIYFLNGPMWSLCFELIANFVHAKLLWRLGSGALLMFTALCGVGLAVIAATFNKVGVGDISSNWWGGFARVGFSYALGVWLGRRHAALPTVTGVPWPVPVAGLVAILTVSQYLPLSQGLGDWLLVVLAMPPLLWIAAGAQLPEHLGAAMDRLGQLSYPIYAIHAPVLGFGLLLTRMASPDAMPLIRFATIVATLTLAWALARSPLARGLPMRKSAGTVPGAVHSPSGATPVGG